MADSPEATDSPEVEGLVIRVDRKQVHIEVGAEVVPCSIRGRFFEQEEQETRPIAVGDRVRISRQGASGVVEALLARRNCVVRRVPRRPDRRQTVAANVDQILIVASLKAPTTRATMVDRLLVVAESSRVEAAVVLNKVDLDKHDKAEAFAGCYRDLGYSIHLVSATEGVGLEAVGEQLRGRISMVIGHSGVGKSTLLNALDPDLNLKVGELNRRMAGRHTTTFSSLIALSALDARVVDTPGVREFGLVAVEPAELGGHFRDLKPFHDQCHYPNCLHFQEPDCAVKQAVEAGDVGEERYSSYLRLLDELLGGGERAARHSSF